MTSGTLFGSSVVLSFVASAFSPCPIKFPDRTIYAPVRRISFPIRSRRELPLYRAQISMSYGLLPADRTL